MSLWTESEFQRVALTTKLSERTLAACRDVLIEGASGIDAAATHKMFPAQISRAIGVLRDKQASMIESAKTMNEGAHLLKFTAAQAAKKIVGPGLAINDAELGKIYVGQVIVITHGFVVQKVGQSGVMHDLGNLEKMPPLNVSLTITYPKYSDKASVKETLPDVGRGKDLGR